MTEFLPIIFTAVMLVLTIVLTVVGIQLILVLNEFKHTLRTINRVVEDADDKMNQVTQSLQSLGGIAAGLRTGVSVFETFVNWLGKRKQEQSEDAG